MRNKLLLLQNVDAAVLFKFINALQQIRVKSVKFIQRFSQIAMKMSLTRTDI